MLSFDVSVKQMISFTAASGEGGRQSSCSYDSNSCKSVRDILTTFSFTLTLLPLSDGRGLGMPTVYGYARCSTDQDRQDVERQARELRAHGADTVRMEYAHGDSPRKAELERILEEAQPGDSIVVLEVSRLARSTKQLCDVIDTVKEKRLRLEIVGSVTVDCTKGEIDPMTNAFLQMAGVFAELELQMTRALWCGEREGEGQEGRQAPAVVGRYPPILSQALPIVQGREPEHDRACQGVRHIEAKCLQVCEAD